MGTAPAQATADALMCQRLHDSRTSQRHSFRTLSAASGIPAPTIHRIEAGKHSPTVVNMRKLAAALEVNPGWLMAALPEKPSA